MSFGEMLGGNKSIRGRRPKCPVKSHWWAKPLAEAGLARDACRSVPWLKYNPYTSVINLWGAVDSSHKNKSADLDIFTVFHHVCIFPQKAVQFFSEMPDLSERLILYNGVLADAMIYSSSRLVQLFLISYSAVRGALTRHLAVLFHFGS